MDWMDLLRCQEQILLEFKPHHLILLMPIAETAHHLPRHFAIRKVVTIQQDHAICSAKLFYEFDDPKNYP
jgi:hypothetical protein